MTTIPVPNGSFVIEFPGALSQEAIAAVRYQLDHCPPGSPLVLQEGARIRHIGPDGTITPAERGRLDWLDFASGMAMGAGLVGIVMSLLS